MAPFIPRRSRRVTSIEPSATVALTDRARALEAEGRDIVTMTAGEPDQATPACIVEAACASLRAGFTHYVPSPGIPELRAAIVRRLVERNRIPLEGPGSVLVVPGAKAGLMFACLALLDEGDECVCPEPGWVSYRECVTFAGATYVPLPTSGAERFSVDPAALARALTPRTRLLIVNSPGNPTGKVWTRAELEAVASLVRDRDLTVLSDEIYEDILFDGREHVSFASLPGMAERTLTLSGFSKSYAMTGWRLGWLAGPAPVIKDMLKIQQHSVTCATSFVQKAAVTALAEADPDVAALVATFKARRARLCEGLAGLPGLKVVQPEGTFYLFLDVSGLGAPSATVAAELLDREGLAVTPGSAFGEAGEGYLRISFAAAESAIDECCRRLGRYVRGRAGR